MDREPLGCPNCDCATAPEPIGAPVISSGHKTQRYFCTCCGRDFTEVSPDEPEKR